MNYSEERELVLDRMVGSGTTLIEARLLNRDAIGVDINLGAVNISRQRIGFPVKNGSRQTVRLGNARQLREKDNSVDLVIAHPPYFDLVKYSSGQNPDDFSSIPSIPKFLDAVSAAIQEMYRVLKQGRYCAVLIGDTRKGQHFVPLSHFLLQRFLRAGFVLKEDIIKTQHNTSRGPRWAASARRFKFYLIMHEHLFVFRKPLEKEQLSRIRFSTWKGVEKAEAAETDEEWRGLFNWEDRRTGA